MNVPPLPPQPPVFGDPTQVNRENRAAVGKGFFMGCGGCFAIVAGFFALIIGGFAIVMFFFANSDVCKEALVKANASGAVRAALGTPLERGWMLGGSINVNGSEGSANVSFSVSGPKGKGTLHLEAVRQNGAWIYKQLQVTPERTGKPIDLLAPVSVTYNCSISFPCNPSNPPLLNTMITSPDLVCDLSRAMIASVEGS